MTATNKKLEKTIEETFDKMDGIVNETLKKDEKQPIQKNNEPVVSGDNKISETSNTETPETNTTRTTTDMGTSEETSDNSETTVDEGNKTSTILEKKESSEIVKEKDENPVETVTPPADEFEQEAEYSDMDNLKILLRQTNKYSYINCGRHLQNGLDNESLKKFYDEFIILGCTNEIDYRVINLIEIILGIKNPSI